MRIALLALAACHVLPPPPVMPPHAGVEMEREGATTVVLAVGIAGEILGGGGLGLALRVEHQTTERMVLGVEVTGGRGDVVSSDDGNFRQDLFALRGYGRSVVSDDHAHQLATYGLGLSWMTSGALTATLHGGFIAGHPNGTIEPVGAFGLALAVPLLRGVAYGDAIGEPSAATAPPPPHHHTDMPIFGEMSGEYKPERVRPSTELFLVFDVGAVIPIGDSNHLSFDIGVAKPTIGKDGILELSIADAEHN